MSFIKRISPHLNRSLALRLVLVIVLVVAVGALYRGSEDPRVRYALMPCVYKQIYGTVGPVEVVFFGSSRMELGVDSFTVARAINRDPATTGVANLARQWGRVSGQVYQELIDLDHERGVEGPIVFEVASGIGEDPFDPATVPMDTLVANWQSKPHSPVNTKVHSLLTQVVHKVDVSVETVLRRRWNHSPPPQHRVRARAQTCIAWPLVDETQIFRPAKYAAVQRQKARDVARQVGASGTWKDLPARAWDVDSLSREGQSFYIDKLVKFGADRNVPVFAVITPGYLENQISPRVAADFQERFGAPLLIPPLELLDQLNSRDGYYYRDRTHLNRRGWIVYTEWLVAAMRNAGWNPRTSS